MQGSTSGHGIPVHGGGQSRTLESSGGTCAKGREAARLGLLLGLQAVSHMNLACPISVLRPWVFEPVDRVLL